MRDRIGARTVQAAARFKLAAHEALCATQPNTPERADVDGMIDLLGGSILRDGIAHIDAMTDSLRRIAARVQA